MHSPRSNDDKAWKAILWIVVVVGVGVFWNLWFAVCGPSYGEPFNVWTVSTPIFGFFATILVAAIMVFFTAGPLYFVCKKTHISNSKAFTWINTTLRNKSLFVVGSFAIAALVGAGFFYGASHPKPAGQARINVDPIGDFEATNSNHLGGVKAE